MQLLRQFDALPDALRGGAVAIGNFDGVHRGHARIVERLIERARELGRASVVFTFDPHPVRLLRPAAAPPPLTWTERKAELLAKLGVDAMLAYPTDAALLALSPKDFFTKCVREGLGARAIVEGPNFYFGRDRAGDIESLRTFAGASGMTLDVVAPLEINGEIVSSSRVRRLIGEGKVQLAREMLTAPYRLRGVVVRGDGRGATIGFPTANLEQIDTQIPAEGVYAGRAIVAGQTFPAAINIGPNPTFDKQQFKVETHVIGWNGSLYDQWLAVDFLAKLREIQRFASVDDLVQQLGRDVATANTISASTGSSFTGP